MSLRRQVIKDAADVPSGSRRIDDDDTQEDEALDDGDDNDELSTSLLSATSSRGKRRRERENKSKPKEMTEEEMMDLALRLSEQEASITALRLQKEEEAVMKAIQESMVGQTQPGPPGPPSQSQSLLADAGASLRICSRRKLSYANGTAAEDDLNAGRRRAAEERDEQSKKRKRKEGSPLLEMPDLSQTQTSLCGSETLELRLDSQQSCDSTQIEDPALRRSPVFPSSRVEVQLPRLSQDLLQTCRTSGFVRCSQDGSAPGPHGPRGPDDLDPSGGPTRPRSPDGGAEPSPECPKSPMFGGNTRQPPSASKPQTGNSGFTSSSEESCTSSVRPQSPVFPRSPGPPQSPVFPRSPGPPQSPVFPRSPGPPQDGPAACTSPVFSDSGGGQTERSRGRCSRTGRLKHSSAAPGGPSSPSSPSSPSTRVQDGQTDHGEDVRLIESSESDDADRPKEASKDGDSAEAELTSDMTLRWSDEDDDVTPVGSPSPVFPEEKPVQQADEQVASMNHVTSASAGPSRPSSSSSSGRQRPPLPVSQGGVSGASAPPGEPAGGSTVHYYWGVPFCPRGLDPDSYTQVIVAQMEVYEKSLKSAQRSLLRKAEWGGAVVPQPEKPPSPDSPAGSPQHVYPPRRGLRLRAKKLCDDAETPPAEEQEEQEEVEEEVKEVQSKGEEEERSGGGAQVDPEDCEVCPETQLSDHDDDDDDRTQDLLMDAEFGAEVRPEALEPPEVEMILQDDSPAVDELQEEQEEEQEEEMEVDAPADGRTKGHAPVSSSSDAGRPHEREEQQEEQEEEGGDPDVEEIKDPGPQRWACPDPEPAESSVDCPLCQASFPAAQIEMHAAYCDGEVSLLHERSAKGGARRKRRRAEATEGDASVASNTRRNQERCFICQKTFPLREYNQHTELCIQRQTARTTGKGNLLSALERTDCRDSEAGPSGSKLQSGDVIELLDDDDEEEAADGGGGEESSIRISNSPIRSFTPISEATGCLVDFKKQRSKKLSQRRR